MTYVGDVRRNADDEDSLTQNEIKALVSLCVLANARSRQTKGLQLFISLMLTARAVNKQVHISIQVYVQGILALTVWYGKTIDQVIANIK